jgi:protein phosphatase
VYGGILRRANRAPRASKHRIRVAASGTSNALYPFKMFIHGDDLPQATAQPQTEFELDASGATSVGRERSRNEDQFLIATMHRNLHVHSSSVGEAAGTWLPGSVEGTLLVVADGMGGHGGGDVASTVAVRAVSEYLCGVMHWSELAQTSPRPRADSLPGVREGLRSAVVLGDREVRRAGLKKGGSPDMGTTLTMAYVRFPLVYVAHVGDTRCYLLRGGELKQLTRDHTLAEELRERAGPDVGDAAAWEHILSNALGGGDGVMARPDLLRHRLEMNDVLLLCSDGLNKELDDSQIAEHLSAMDNAADASVRLVAAADAAGGSDNITAVVARCVGGLPPPRQSQ